MTQVKKPETKQNELKTKEESDLLTFLEEENKKTMRFVKMLITTNDKEQLENGWLREHNQRLIQKVVEMLDEMAFESDDGYKVELFINWEEAKKKLT